MERKETRQRLQSDTQKLSSLERLRCSKIYVRHPRYGGTPLRSNDAAAQTAARKHFRGNSPGPVPVEVYTGIGLYYPDSAIRVRLARSQGIDWAPILCMDRGRRCRTCGRWVLFWALERKYWHEVLKFQAFSDCVDCWECRRDRHEKARLAGEHEELLLRDEKTVEQWKRLASVGDRLFEIGYIRKPATLAKTRVPKRLRLRID